MVKNTTFFFNLDPAAVCMIDGRAVPEGSNSKCRDDRCLCACSKGQVEVLACAPATTEGNKAGRRSNLNKGPGRRRGRKKMRKKKTRKKKKKRKKGCRDKKGSKFSRQGNGKKRGCREEKGKV